MDRAARRTIGIPGCVEMSGIKSRGVDGHTLNDIHANQSFFEPREEPVGDYSSGPRSAAIERQPSDTGSRFHAVHLDPNLGRSVYTPIVEDARSNTDVGAFCNWNDCGRRDGDRCTRTSRDHQKKGSAG